MDVLELSMDIPPVTLSIPTAVHLSYEYPRTIHGHPTYCLAHERSHLDILPLSMDIQHTVRPVYCSNVDVLGLSMDIPPDTLSIQQSYPVQWMS